MRGLVVHKEPRDRPSVQQDARREASLQAEREAEGDAHAEARVVRPPRAQQVAHADGHGACGTRGTQARGSR